MKQTERFAMRINHEERVMFAELAKRLKRSQSDAVRFIVREVLFALIADENNQSVKENLISRK